MDKPKMPRINVEERLRALSPGVSGLVLLSAVNAGLERIHERAYQGVVDGMYRQGETQESILRKVEGLPIPPQLKVRVIEHVETLGSERPAIEVESTVEEA